MKWLCWMLPWACLFGSGLHAQVELLATSGDGRTLLFHSYFRLQTESDVDAQGKIYRWQDGTWTRLAAAARISSGFALSPPDVFGPLLSTDAAVAGWQINIGCILCQVQVGPAFSSELLGVRLPSAFPHGTLRMSPNGRYFTADNYPYTTWLAVTGVQYLDAATGLIAEIPVDLFTRPVVRELANDGTALLLITGPKDASQGIAPGVLSLWKPGSDPQPIYSDTRILAPTISATGGKVAFEAVSDDGSRTLVVIDTQTEERLSIAPMPSVKFQARVESFAKPRWDGSGSQLLYRSVDDQGALTIVSLWDVARRTSRVLLTASEPVVDAVISGDGTTGWVVTTANRLVRLDLGTSQADEILPPLGAGTNGVFSDVVPGSAVLIPGTGLTKAQKVFDGNNQLPVADATPEGLWVQIPWEYASSPRNVHQILIRSENNPFEAVVNIAVTPDVLPRIITWIDPATDLTYAKAVHQDFQSVVTPASPARSGEIVHVYLTGLGPLDQPLPTGAPGPLTPLLHPVTPLQCLFVNSSPPQPLDMPYVGYAVGLVGFYQADLKIPDGVGTGTQQLLCSVVTPSGKYSSAAFLVTTSTPTQTQ